jgi:hypothetical protein
VSARPEPSSQKSKLESQMPELVFESVLKAHLEVLANSILNFNFN